MAITLSPTATEEIKRIMEQQSMPTGTCLRVGVQGGGCSGASYFMDFEKDGAKTNDLVSQSGGIQILMDKQYADDLDGLLIEFGTGINNRGFYFHNPNAVESCGCGSSFNTAKGKAQGRQGNPQHGHHS